MKHRTVAAVMTPAEKVVTVLPGTPYKEIARLLTEHEISALPVLGEDHRVLGIVSEADLLPKESRSQEPPPARPPLTPTQARNRHKAEAATALELMTAPVMGAATTGPPRSEGNPVAGRPRPGALAAGPVLRTQVLDAATMRSCSAWFGRVRSAPRPAARPELRLG